MQERHGPLETLVGYCAPLRTSGCAGATWILHDAEVPLERQAQEITGRGRIELPPKSQVGVSFALPGVVVEAPDHHLATFTGHEADSPS